MHSVIAQLFYRLMRDEGLTAETIANHLLQCGVGVPCFSNLERGADALNLADMAKRQSEKPTD